MLKSCLVFQVPVRSTKEGSSFMIVGQRVQKYLFMIVMQTKIMSIKEFSTPYIKHNLLVTLAVSCASAASLVSSLVSTMLSLSSLLSSSLVSIITATRAVPHYPAESKVKVIFGRSCSISTRSLCLEERLHLFPPQNWSWTQTSSGSLLACPVLLQHQTSPRPYSRLAVETLL